MTWQNWQDFCAIFILLMLLGYVLYYKSRHRASILSQVEGKSPRTVRNVRQGWDDSHWTYVRFLLRNGGKYKEQLRSELRKVVEERQLPNVKAVVEGRLEGERKGEFTLAVFVDCSVSKWTITFAIELSPYGGKDLVISCRMVSKGGSILGEIFLGQKMIFDDAEVLVLKDVIAVSIAEAIDNLGLGGNVVKL